MNSFKENSPLNPDSELSSHNRSAVVFEFLRTIQAILAVVLLVWTLLWTTSGRFGLQTVSLTEANTVITSVAANDRVSIIASISLCIFLFTSIETSRISTRKRVDLLQLFGSLLLVSVCFGFLFFFSSFQFASDSSECVQRSCFPQPLQELLLGAPIAFVSLLMFVLSLSRHRIHWIVRAILPVAAFCVASYLQGAIWDTTIVPFLLTK